MSEDLRRKLTIAKGLKETRSRSEFTDEQVLDFFIAANGISSAAAKLAGKSPQQFNARIKKAFSRTEAKLSGRK